jgi:hypothetical protein
LREDDDNGRMILSLRELQKDLAWERCRQLQMDNVTIRAKVTRPMEALNVFILLLSCLCSILFLLKVCKIWVEN